MPRVVVPVRYPLSSRSRRTLAEAVRVAEERDAELTVLHVNLYQDGGRVTRTDLKRAVQGSFGELSRTRYVVRDGFLVEQTILDEVAAERADAVVIGRKQASRWRHTFRRLLDDPDVESFLRDHLDCEVITVDAA